MNYKSAFWILLVIFLLFIGAGGFPLYSINKKLDKIDACILENEIAKYIKAGWMPPIEYIKIKRTKAMKPKER